MLLVGGTVTACCLLAGKEPRVLAGSRWMLLPECCIWQLM